jgi:hypothetical protein
MFVRIFGKGDKIFIYARAAMREEQETLAEFPGG